MDKRIKILTKKEFGYLLGMFLGDGYAHHHKKSRHYTVSFYLNTNKDSDIIAYVNRLLTKLDFNVLRFDNKRDNCTRVYIHSKDFMYFIKNQIEQLRKVLSTKDLRLGFLSGFIDAEGWVRKGDIVLTQKDKKVLEFAKELSKEFNAEGKLWKNKNYITGNDIWRLRVSTRFKYSPHNSLKVYRIYGGNDFQS